MRRVHALPFFPSADKSGKVSQRTAAATEEQLGLRGQRAGSATPAPHLELLNRLAPSVAFPVTSLVTLALQDGTRPIFSEGNVPRGGGEKMLPGKTNNLKPKWR